MSFGKDDSQLGNIPVYGSSGSFTQTGHTSNVARGRGRSKMPYWRNTLELSEDPQQPSRVRLIPADYKQLVVDQGTQQLVEMARPFVEFREHFHASSNRGAICSAGPRFLDKQQRDPCRGCDMWEEDKVERDAKKARGDDTKGPRRISRSDKFSFTALDYAYYFEMPQTDSRTGQFRMNPKTNQPYMEWVKAFNPQDPIFSGRKWRESSTRPWVMPKTHKDKLVDRNIIIGQQCLNCGQPGMYSRGWFCGNPQCRQLIFDPNNTTLSPDEQKSKSRELYSCPHCNTRAHPIEVVQCLHCGGDKRAQIFDVDLYVYLAPTGNGKQKSLEIVTHGAPGPVVLQDPEAMKWVKPLKLIERFAPSSIEEQAKLWNITSPAPAPQPAAPQQQQQWAPPPGAPQPYAPPAPAPAPAPMPPNPQGMPTDAAGNPVYQAPPQAAPMVAPPQPPPPVAPPAPPAPAAPQPGGDVASMLAALSGNSGDNN